MMSSDFIFLGKNECAALGVRAKFLPGEIDTERLRTQIWEKDFTCGRLSITKPARSVYELGHLVRQGKNCLVLLNDGGQQVLTVGPSFTVIHQEFTANKGLLILIAILLRCSRPREFNKLVRDIPAA